MNTNRRAASKSAPAALTTRTEWQTPNGSMGQIAVELGRNFYAHVMKDGATFRVVDAHHFNDETIASVLARAAAHVL